MMTGKRLIISALVLALVQIGFLSWIIAGRAAILRNGKEVLLKVEPVDPRDLLRGDYIILAYGISRIPVKMIANIPADKLSSDDTSIVVRLKKGADGYWQPKYSVPNARMVEAVQVLARTEGVLLDPVYTGKVMAGLIGLARSGAFEDGARVLFMHTGGLPALHAYEREIVGAAPVAP